MARIFAFGSSTTYGLSDQQHGGWVNRLKTSMLVKSEVEGHSFVPVYNFGVPGQLIANTVKRLEADIGSYIDFPGRDLAIFAIGSLDSALKPDSTETNTNIEEFQKLLPKIGELCVSIALEHGKDPIIPIFTGLAPVDDDHPISRKVPNRNSNFNRRIFESEIQSYAYREGYMYIDIFPQVQIAHYKHEEGALGSDGIHPNHIGHAAIHDVVYQAVNQILDENSVVGEAIA